MLCSEKRARQLLQRGRARVHKLTPFAIRLADRLAENGILQPVRLKLDPGSRPAQELNRQIEARTGRKQ